MPVEQETLLRIFLIGMSSTLPLNGQDCLTIAETLIKRSGSMNEEYITLNIDNTDDPLQPESPEEIKQNLTKQSLICLLRK